MPLLGHSEQAGGSSAASQRIDATPTARTSRSWSVALSPALRALNRSANTPLDSSVSATIDLEVDPTGATRAGFSASGQLNRRDFGVNFNKLLETGGMVIGDKVDIDLEIEGVLNK